MIFYGRYGKEILYAAQEILYAGKEILYAGKEILCAGKEILYAAQEILCVYAGKGIFLPTKMYWSDLYFLLW